MEHSTDRRHKDIWGHRERWGNVNRQMEHKDREMGMHGQTDEDAKIGGETWTDRWGIHQEKRKHGQTHGDTETDRDTRMGRWGHTDR